MLKTGWKRRNLLKVLGAGLFAAGSGSPAEARAETALSHTHANAFFAIAYDRRNGSVRSIVSPSDAAAMNWLSCADNAPWQLCSQQWGLGYADLGKDLLHRGRWAEPQTVDIRDNAAVVTYRVGALKVEVRRTLDGDAFKERYIFTNAGSQTLPISDATHAGFGIYMPFNDHYTNAADVLEHRCHAHLWTGGTSSWVAMLRMGGRAPHLGLVLTEGALVGYSITGRDQITSSNTRGTFVVHPALRDLAPGESRAIAWNLFWHNGWDDFLMQCTRRSPAFVGVQVSRYTAYRGETIDIRFDPPVGPATTLMHEARSLSITGNMARFAADATGEAVLRLTSSRGADTRICLNVVPPMDELIAARVKFIVDRQQVRNAADPADGAFVVYDNQLETQVRRDWGSDRNEGRERLGMGVLLARWLRGLPDPEPAVRQALLRYYAFVSTKLQRPDGSVLDGLSSKRVRLYNWPWVAQLHLEMARLTGAQDAYAAFVRTIRNFYLNGGREFYAIGLPVYEGLRALNAAGRSADAKVVRDLFVAHGRRMADIGIHYPASEVNFEQSIVAPAAIFLLELYRSTGDAKWLKAAKPHFELLTLFGGRQPDHHLHDVAIRHWDGYWFGKNRSWGDTFPHYWSTLTALAFDHYGKITKDKDWIARADGIIRNNLSLFSVDGRGSAAFVYPLSVNGQRAYFADPYANDQDWALVHALQIREG